MLNLSLCSMCFGLDVFERVVNLTKLRVRPHTSLLSKQYNYEGKMQHSFKMGLTMLIVITFGFLQLF
jgi:hypothetical protein